MPRFNSPLPGVLALAAVVVLAVLDGPQPPRRAAPVPPLNLHPNGPPR